MIKRSDLTIEKNQHGAFVISALVGGYLKTTQFYDYTKSQAIRLFLQNANNK